MRIRSTRGFRVLASLLAWILSNVLFRSPFVHTFVIPQLQSRHQTSSTRFVIKQRDDVKEKTAANGRSGVNGDVKGPMSSDTGEDNVIVKGKYGTKEAIKRNGAIQEVSKTTNKAGTPTKMENGTKGTKDTTAVDSNDILDLLEEVNSRVVLGTADILNNLTLGVEQKLVGFPETSAQELSSLITEFSSEIQRAQKNEVERQIAELERKLIRPLEDFAFSDAPLYDAKQKTNPSDEEDLAFQNTTQLILMGKNSTLEMSRRMRTKEILQNFNVAPFYYSIALLTRWARKASYPSIYLLSMYRSLANVIKSNTKGTKKYEFDTIGGEGLQAGWKRTGEIAAKGSFAKKWAIFRRSAEIWAYFSSFYLKDRRISAMYNRGKWSEEKFKEERSKLGKEITDNLLKLGPTFIKGKLCCVRTYFVLHS